MANSVTRKVLWVILLLSILETFALEVGARELKKPEMPPEVYDFINFKLVSIFWSIAAPIAGLSTIVKTYVIGVIVAMLGMGMIVVLFVTAPFRKMAAYTKEGAAHFKIPRVDFSIRGSVFFIGVLGGFAVIVGGMVLAFWDVYQTSP
jgi:hypothetical protein